MIFYFDGGCKPNPGKMEVAVVSSDGSVKEHQVIHDGTNNEAEWIAFLWAASYASVWAENNPGEVVTISGDSNLVVQQAQGNWKVKQETLRPFLVEWQANLKGLFVPSLLKIEHVGRNDNPAGHYIESLYK